MFLKGNEFMKVPDVSEFLEHLRPISMAKLFGGRTRVLKEYDGDYTVESLIEWLSQFAPTTEVETGYDGELYVEVK